MYDRNKVLEEKCYEISHVQEVMSIIQTNFNKYFEIYIETCAGVYPSSSQIERIQNNLSISTTTKTFNQKEHLLTIIQNAIQDFESDREKYEEIFVSEDLIEYEDAPATFKSMLKVDCPIIRYTLNSREKSLDSFKRHFKHSQPQELLNVLMNIVTYAEEYPDKWKDFDYDAKYDVETLLDDILESNIFDEEDYSVLGVIGGGIKSYIIHKLSPSYFAHRSKEAVWSLWYLTEKKSFDCEQDSEFLMIDTKASTTQQNFYYPYGQFSIYAYYIYTLIREEVIKYDVITPEDYRYVIVNDFLKFVAMSHQDEIDIYMRNIKESDYY